MNSFILFCNSLISGSMHAFAHAAGLFFPSGLGLMLISALLGILLACIYGKLANQQQILTIKKSISASFHESILFRHDPILTIKAQVALLVSGIRYLGTTALPISILCIPSIILFSAIQNYYGFDPLKNDTVLTVVFDDPSSVFMYTASSDDLPLSPPLRIPASNELVYKVSPGATTLRLEKNGSADTYDISPIVSQHSSSLVSSSWIDSLLFGATASAPSGIKTVSISKGLRDYAFWGFSQPWYIWSVFCMFAGGFIAAKLFRITF